VGFSEARPSMSRSETAENNAGYILATSLASCRASLWSDGSAHPGQGLSEAYPLCCRIPGSRSPLKNVEFRGRHYDIAVSRDGAGKVRLTRNAL